MVLQEVQVVVGMPMHRVGEHLEEGHRSRSLVGVVLAGSRGIRMEVRVVLKVACPCLVVRRHGFCRYIWSLHSCRVVGPVVDSRTAVLMEESQMVELKVETRTEDLEEEPGSLAEDRERTDSWLLNLLSRSTVSNNTTVWG